MGIMELLKAVIKLGKNIAINIVNTRKDIVSDFFNSKIFYCILFFFVYIWFACGNRGTNLGGWLFHLVCLLL